MSEHAAAIDRTPAPSLTYHFWARDWRPDPNGVVAETGSPRIHSIDQASAWNYNGLRVTLTGPLLKRDCGPGRHNRTLVVDLNKPQPTWLANLIRDARVRLSRPEWAESMYVYPPAKTEGS